MGKHPPSFNFWVSDFRDGVRHLSLDQIGAYVLFLIEQFETELLPINKELLRSILENKRCSRDQFDDLWESLSRKFDEVFDGSPNGLPIGYRNAKMHEVRKETIDRWEKHKEEKKRKKAGGIRGAKKRWENTRPDGLPIGAPTEEKHGSLEREPELEPELKKSLKRKVLLETGALPNTGLPDTYPYKSSEFKKNWMSYVEHCFVCRDGVLSEQKTDNDLKELVALRDERLAIRWLKCSMSVSRSGVLCDPDKYKDRKAKAFKLGDKL